MEGVEKSHGLGGSFSLKAICHQRSRGFENLATFANEARVLNDAIVDFEIKNETIAAGSVEPRCLIGRVLHQTTVPGMIGVVFNELVIEFVEHLGQNLLCLFEASHKCVDLVKR